MFLGQQIKLSYDKSTVVKKLDNSEKYGNAFQEKILVPWLGDAVTVMLDPDLHSMLGDAVMFDLDLDWRLLEPQMAPGCPQIPTNATQMAACLTAWLGLFPNR